MAAARQFLEKRYPGAAIRVEVRAHTAQGGRAISCQGSGRRSNPDGAYDRNEFMALLRSIPPPEDPEEASFLDKNMKVLDAQLPERGGYCRPHQLGQIVEVVVAKEIGSHTKSKEPYAAVLSELGDVARTGWRAVHRVNIIELVSTRRFPPWRSSAVSTCTIAPWQSSRLCLLGSRSRTLQRRWTVSSGASSASLGTCSAHSDKSRARSSIGWSRLAACLTGYAIALPSTRSAAFTCRATPRM